MDAAATAGYRPIEYARALIAGGVQGLQIRAKHASGRDLVRLCDAVVDAARSAGTLVIVNDRVDIARLCGADGVHLGQADVPPDAARTQLGASAVIGWSTHSAGQARAALSLPISYLAIGPVFGTTTKDTGYEAVGLDQVTEVSALARTQSLPVVAIGGITLGRVPSVIAAGADAVAVIGDLFTGGDPEARAREYLRVLDGAAAN